MPFGNSTVDVAATIGKVAGPRRLQMPTERQLDNAVSADLAF